MIIMKKSNREIDLFWSFIYCAVFFIGPALVGNTISSKGVDLKNLFMFWGGMAYMWSLQKIANRRRNG